MFIKGQEVNVIKQDGSKVGGDIRRVLKGGKYQVNVICPHYGHKTFWTLNETSLEAK